MLADRITASTTIVTVNIIMHLPFTQKYRLIESSQQLDSTCFDPAVLQFNVVLRISEMPNELLNGQFHVYSLTDCHQHVLDLLQQLTNYHIKLRVYTLSFTF